MYIVAAKLAPLPPMSAYLAEKKHALKWTGSFAGNLQQENNKDGTQVGTECGGKVHKKVVVGFGSI